jgi:predicted Zn finger-like uncharacterized protein
MSLITRCPACGTLFKVVPDQLRISEGWVRCGHCAEVFDATAHLQDDAVQPQEQPPTAAPAAPPHPVVAEASETVSELEAFPSSLNTEIGESLAFDPPDSAEFEAEAEALVEDPRDRPFEFRRRDDSELETSGRPQALTGRSWEVDSEDDDACASALPGAADDGLRDLSFVRAARRKAFWARPRVRTALLLALCALGVLLAFQVALHDRDRLASARPALRPWLAGLCAALDCAIAPPRQIDSIAIDGSSFNKLGNDAYRLNVTLKNQAGIELAMPALELTLTDVQDRPVVRRVLMPAELAPGATVITAASEWSGSLALAVANGAGPRIAGYRLLAFYP